MSGDGFSVVPVCYAKVECGANGKMDDCDAGWFLEVFFQNDEGGEGLVCSERGYFADAELVAVAVGGAADVFGVGEEVY